MQASPVMDEYPEVTPTESDDAPAESIPEWSTLEARRRRTFVFLLFAAVYVGYHLVSRWVEYPLFHLDWYYFGGEDWPKLPIWSWPWREPEFAYRWFLTLLPLIAWASIILFLLTRISYLTHRRIAFVVVLLGLTFFEGDMRWYNMAKKHVSWNEILAVLDQDASSDLGLRSSDYEDFAWQFAYHVLFLSLCAFFAGPEPRLILRAIWNGPIGVQTRNCIQAIWSGPISATYFGIACRRLYHADVALWLENSMFRVLGWLDSRPAFACIVVLVMIDPIVIWALDKEKQDNQTERTVIRHIALANPLRWHSLDRAWDRVVLAYSEESQELAAANSAMRELDTLSISARGPILAIPKRKVPQQPDSILILQSESWSAEIFNETEMPYLNEFAKKCLRLKRHYSAANATHYGVLGLLHGNPVTFFTGPRTTHRPNPYLDHFKDHGYKSRLITRAVMGHHKLGHYLPNWTEPVSEPGGDWKVIPEIHEELAKPEPRLVYSFYHATHYPYDHDNEPRFKKYLPEVEYEFNYNRSGLSEWKEQIVNRYKNTMVQMDDWFRDILQKVDHSKTIVVITGDHGEEFFQQGRLGHCSSLNIHQTMTPCMVYIPGVEPADVNFVTSHADIMPTIADALGHAKKPETLGQSLFEPVSFRFAVVSHFEYSKCMLWAVATEDRMAVFERDYRDNIEIISLTDCNGNRKTYRDDAQLWDDRFRIIRRVEEQLRASKE